MTNNKRNCGPVAALRTTCGDGKLSRGNFATLLNSYNATSPFDQLTVRLILAQHRNGTLSEGMLLALLAAVGLKP